MTDFNSTTWDDLPLFLSKCGEKDGQELGRNVIDPENLKRLCKAKDAFYWNRSFNVGGKRCILRMSFEIMSDGEIEEA